MLAGGVGKRPGQDLGRVGHVFGSRETESRWAGSLGTWFQKDPSLAQWHPTWELWKPCSPRALPSMRPPPPPHCLI